jgi:hypothetical protein
MQSELDKQSEYRQSEYKKKIEQDILSVSAV